MHKTHFPTQSLVIAILLASMLSAFAYLALHAPQVQAAPAPQTLPTAEPCQPAVLEPTSSAINARSGPGPNYAILAELTEGQAYAVAGRHHGFAWWAVTLPDGSIGWVWDNVVSVSGNVAAVPLLEAPPLNGVVPDTDQDWTPTGTSPPCEAAPEAVTDAQPAQEATPPVSVSNRMQNEWETPVNLSMSGGATAPTIIVDEAGAAHAIWQEEGIESFVYSQGPTDWTAPVPVELPFGTRIYYPELGSNDATPLFTPLLVADGAGRIHALWIDDDDGNLYHSSVPSAEFANIASWSQRLLLEESVVKIDVTVDASQTLHVTYARSRDAEEQPSGLYYIQSRDAGASWSSPILLHQTRYFRTLSSSELSVSIAASGMDDQANVFVGWDNRILDRVFLVRSLDGGASWTESTTIDSREFDDPPDAAGPAQIIVQTYEDQLHLLWRAGHEAQSCGLYHQWSGDDGETWQSRQLLPVETPTCPLRSQFLLGRDGLLFVLTAIEQQGILLAWDGERWSDAQREAMVNQFIDPETSRQVTFHWQDATIAPGNRLLIIGPDGAEKGDVWLIAHLLADIGEWFPAPSVWSPLQEISATETRPESPLLVSDHEGRLHAFWTQAESVSSAESAIYYSLWSEGEWTRPAPVLASPNGFTQEPSVTLGPGEHLFAVWQAGDGLLYFSQALAEVAFFAQEWSDPAPLATITGAARSPQIAAAPNGNLHVAYAVSLNEQRGLYVITSDDQGLTWSDPVRVFDAVAADWEMVGSPRLAISGNGTMHLLWTRYTLPPVATPLSLHYARSDDGGQTWSSATVVDEGPINWSALVASGDAFAHRIWRTERGDRVGYWNNVSVDGGQDWSREEQVPAQISEIGAPAVAVDQAGRTHLIVVAVDELRYLSWNMEGWNIGEHLPFKSGERESLVAESLVAATTVDSLGRLAVIYTGEVETSEEDSAEYTVLNTIQELQIPEATVISSATVSPTSISEPAPTSTPTPVASPTIVLPVEPGGDDGRFNIPFLNGSSSVVSLLISVVPVLLLVVVALFFGLRRNRTRR